MLSGTRLTYASAPSPWLSLELNNAILNSLAIALVTTLLSFQAAAVLTDILLGIKPRKAARVHALHTLLLAHQSSPLAVTTGILRHDALTRLYYRPDLPPDLYIAREPMPIRTPVALRLLLLLIIAPLVNVLSVVLTLERTHFLSFSDAGVGGLALGLTDSLAAADVITINDICVRNIFTPRLGDTISADFNICGPVPFFKEQNDSRAFVAVYHFRDAIIYIAVQIGRYYTHVARQATVNIVDRNSMSSNYIVKVKADNTTALRLVDLGISLIRPHCIAFDPTSEKEDYIQLGNLTFIRAKSFECQAQSDNDKENALATLDNLSKRITLVNSDRLNLAMLGHGEASVSSPFVDRADLQFLERRSRYLGLPALTLFTAAVVLLRIFTAMLCNNDIDEGIELVLRRALDIKCCQSLLREGKREVVFNRKFQNDHVAHYGLVRKDMIQVEQFREGILGADLLDEQQDDRFTATTSNGSTIDDRELGSKDPLAKK